MGKLLERFNNAAIELNKHYPVNISDNIINLYIEIFNKYPVCIDLDTEGKYLNDSAKNLDVEKY